MKSEKSFWDDLQRNYNDKEFRSEFDLQILRIQTVDRIINTLDEARKNAEMSKAELARTVDVNPAAIRRLLTSKGNPTLGSISDIAAVFGLRLALVPMHTVDSAR